MNAMHVRILVATATCYVGEEDLDTKFNVSNSIIIKEGFYLLKDAVPCDGRISSIELCGVLIDPDATIESIRVYLNASLYRPRQTNKTQYLERIRELVYLNQSITDSATTVQLDNGVTCARLSVVEYNWIAEVGDILGVGFVNSSCEVQTFDYGFGVSFPSQICPIHVAVLTNSSSDMVYLSENNSTTHLDTLSNDVGIKLNLQAFVGESMQSSIVQLDLIIISLLNLAL